MDFLKNAPDFLKYGLLGLGMFLSILSFYLLYQEQRKREPRKLILTSTYIYMVFSIVVLMLGIYSEISIHKAKSNTHIKKVSSSYIDSLGYHEWAQNTEQTEQKLMLYKDDDLWDYIRTNSNQIEELFICGAHLQNGVGRIKDVIENVLSKNGSVKIVMTNPADTITQLIQGDRKEPASQSSLISGLISSTLDDLREIRQSVYSGELSVHFLDRPLDERIHVINPNKENGKAFLKLYPYKHQNQQGVAFGGYYFSVNNGDEAQAYTYHYYREKFIRYYEAGEKYEI